MKLADEVSNMYRLAKEDDNQMLILKRLEGGGGGQFDSPVIF